MLLDIRKGLHNHLLSNAAIAAIVGTRVYPVKNAEGNRLDCIVYFRVLETELYHYLGRAGLVGARFQIDVLSQTNGQANALADLVKEALSGYSGLWSYGGNSPSDTVPVQGVFLQTAFEDYDEETKLYRVSRDYMIWYEDN